MNNKKASNNYSSNNNDNSSNNDNDDDNNNISNNNNISSKIYDQSLPSQRTYLGESTAPKIFIKEFYFIESIPDVLAPNCCFSCKVFIEIIRNIVPNLDEAISTCKTNANPEKKLELFIHLQDFENKNIPNGILIKEACKDPEKKISATIEKSGEDEEKYVATFENLAFGEMAFEKQRLLQLKLELSYSGSTLGTLYSKRFYLDR